LILLAVSMTAQTPVPEIPFESVPDFFKLPAGMNFGEVTCALSAIVPWRG
jgi:hypothetical protein